jgi:hypothetical protein
MTQDPSRLSPGDIVYIERKETHRSGIIFCHVHEVLVSRSQFAIDSWLVEGRKLNVYGYFADYPEEGRFIPFSVKEEDTGYLIDGREVLIPRPEFFDGVARSNYNPQRVLPEQPVQPAPRDQGKTVDKFKLVENMRRRGGNFVSKLADALIAADPQNTERIIKAFPDIVEKYSS